MTATVNRPNAADIFARLGYLLDDLKALDLSTVDAAHLAPLATAIKNAAEFGSAVHIEIERRVLANGELLPGVTTKDEVKHRIWTDTEAAEELAQAEFGDKAFKRTLLSPAQMEKLGDKGKAFVAIASVKPEAGKKVVY